MAKKYDEEEGVWRTVGGRRIFIRTGQSLSKAMKESGKFGNKRNKKITLKDDEYELYKQAKENPDSIDAMTENSTDWKALDRKYKDRYNTELYNKSLKEIGINKQISEADYREMSKTLNKEIASGLKKSIEMEKDNLERRKANGDSVENISNATRNIHNMELELQQAQSRISSPRDEIMYHLKKGNFATAEKYIKENGLEDEREEFMDGLNYKARQAYRNAEKTFDKKIYSYESQEELDKAQSLRDLNTGIIYDKVPGSEQYKSRKDGYHYYIDTNVKNKDNPQFETYNKTNGQSSNPWEKRKAELLSGESQEAKRDYQDYLSINGKKETGYETYLKDRYGTKDENIVSAGYKSKNDLYQEYKNETIRNINNKRMERGTTTLNEAYKKAFEEYKRKHPNTKLTLQKFIEMSEE